MTLLQSYIQKETKDYVEPERRGTPWGEPIGFSRIKHLSVVVQLSNLGLQEVSDLLSVKYGVLRLWRTEDSYRKALEMHIDSVTKLFIKNLQDAIFRYDYEEEGLPVVGYGFVPDRKFDESISDLPIYGETLLHRIYTTGLKLWKPEVDRNYTRAFFSALYYVFAFRKGMSVEEIVARTKNGVELVDMVEQMQRPWKPTDEDAAREREQFTAFIREL